MVLTFIGKVKISGSCWQTKMELYTTTSPISTATLNVNATVKLNGTTLISSDNMKENIREFIFTISFNKLVYWSTLS